jgi:hypothetical protein
MRQPLPGNPSDNTDLLAVLERYAAAGYAAHLLVTDDGLVECTVCGTRSRPEDVSAGEIRRLEGASDPDDMMAVVKVECPACGARGALVMGYGPNASPGEAAAAPGFRTGPVGNH